VVPDDPGDHAFEIAASGLVEADLELVCARPAPGGDSSTRQPSGSMSSWKIG
jgi:hypothetical protein